MRLITRVHAPASVILIRLMVGLVFLSEGLQKFIYPDDVGVGRFIKIGLPQPELLAPFVACFEITCGIFIALGLLTRMAVLPTITIMLVAIVTTKIPILAEEGFFKMAHAARTDWSMLIGSIFLLIVGPGPVSIDKFLVRQPQDENGRSSAD